MTLVHPPNFTALSNMPPEVGLFTNCYLAFSQVCFGRWLFLIFFFICSSKASGICLSSARALRVCCVYRSANICHVWCHSKKNLRSGRRVNSPDPTDNFRLAGIIRLVRISELCVFSLINQLWHQLDSSKLSLGWEFLIENALPLSHRPFFDVLSLWPRASKTRKFKIQEVTRTESVTDAWGTIAELVAVILAHKIIVWNWELIS